jgi:pSer/pThr/pTyr-binding forkhead associated (FHA) protein
MAAKLYFVSGELRGEVIPLGDRETTIGRDPAMDLVIPAGDQRFVSRLHAVIRVEDGRHVVEDRDSTNGTWVNGSRVRRVVLVDGDEIQFGRQGPVARFRSEHAEAETVLARPGREPAEAHASRSLPPLPPPTSEERPSQLVRRLVKEEMAPPPPRPRARAAFPAVGVLIVALAAGGGAALFGLPGGAEAGFRRLAADYESRVVLVETGVRADGRYFKLGNGSGFVADDGGLIVTNKHVVHGHLYHRDRACIAESFRQRRLSFEDSMVITVWLGGSRFRQTPTATQGDRTLGYSTEHGTLRLAASAPDSLLTARTARCTDFFGGSDFAMDWQPHAIDSNDLAVLRASGRLRAIPLASREPRADDRVMVYGFPGGVTPLETNHAEPIRRTGRVLRIQETIQIDAVVLHGNSGGPLIGADGRVVGITTRGPAETLNMAIKVEHARRLLDRAREAEP